MLLPLKDHSISNLEADITVVDRVPLHREGIVYLKSNLLPNAPTIRRTNTFYGAAGNGRVGFVALDDCARVAAHVLTDDIAKHDGQNYEITGPEALTFTEVAARFSHVFDHTIRHEDMPVEAFGQLLVMEAHFRPETIEIDILCHFRAFRRGDADLVTDTFTRLTGGPSTSINAFLREHTTTFTP